MKVTLEKVHGSMNTFYMVDGEERDDYAGLALQLCGKDQGVDGLLVILPSNSAHAKMRVFNRDGSEASMCGNGLRCVARYVCEKEGVDEAVIETMKADLAVRREETLMDGIETYSVQISPVSFQLKDLPMEYGNQTTLKQQAIPEISEEIMFSAVAVPNPHLIGIVPEEIQKSPEHQKKWAEKFNGQNDYFSDGVNVSYVTKVGQGIFVRTYERGVGFTNACGTAMTASALISCMSDMVPFGEVAVYNPGGMVKCTIKKSGDTFELLLTGNATRISVHEFLWEEEQADSEFTAFEILEEQRHYEKFIEEISVVVEQFA
ncbi:diaminopimelate epimerase [Planomicrobium sp. Y74]|uniref:diaminopimelate epimerase n=1 Tax=Planomicrobium sp. Y74 TaxID=2478977 RepID=UPI000EF51004|nr:diaminopimelate epimerase [Planomicrobium sp. Y74]RLQ92481.1 diaminopimelate epimerase [Planomicrobium sp. Y74]